MGSKKEEEEVRVWLVRLNIGMKWVQDGKGGPLRKWIYPIRRYGS